MKVQSRLVQARLIKMHQNFEKKKVGYFSSRALLVYGCMYIITEILLQGRRN